MFAYLIKYIYYVIFRLRIFTSIGYIIMELTLKSFSRFILTLYFIVFEFCYELELVYRTCSHLAGTDIACLFVRDRIGSVGSVDL